MQQESQILNFVITGEVRSGSAVIQSSINNRPDKAAVCHADLFHHDDKVRRAAHEAYFGPSKDPQRLPEWFQEGESHPWQYINHAVLDRPMKGEKVVGFRIMYPTVRKWELYDLFHERWKEGDFCLIHVTRNPVACFISLKQAERFGVWRRDWNSPPQMNCPSPVNVDATELTEFCRNHTAVYGKIRATCEDRLDIAYRDIFLDYNGVMQRVFEFLELPYGDDPVMPACRRLKNRSILDRISNLDQLLKQVPSDVKGYLNAEDLF